VKGGGGVGAYGTATAAQRPSTTMAGLLLLLFFALAHLLQAAPAIFWAGSYRVYTDVVLQTQKSAAEGAVNNRARWCGGSFPERYEGRCVTSRASDREGEAREQDPLTCTLETLL
jgi:hypothetical protein